MFFSEDNPQLRAFEALEKTYTRDDNILVVVTPKDSDVFTPENLAIAEHITQRLWQTPYATRVDSITNFQHSTAQGDELFVGDLVHGADRLSPADIARIKQIALNEPLLRNRLISPDGQVMGFNVIVRRPGNDQNAETMEAVAFVRNLAADVQRAHPGISFRLTGALMIDTAFAESSERDAKTLTPTMLTIIVVGLWWFLRSVIGMLAAATMMTLSVVSAIGLAGWGGIVFSPSSIPAPTILLTLAVADSVHVLTAYYAGISRGLSQQAAMKESLQVNFKAIFFTNLTTAVGFWSMNYSDAPPFRDLGNITAMGVGVAYVLTISFLPALMMVLPVTRGHAAPAGGTTFVTLAGWIAKHRYSLAAIVPVVIGAVLACIPLNRLDDLYVRYFDESITFRSDTDYITKHLTGMYNIDYSIEQGAPGGINEPAFLEQVERFAQWFRSSRVCRERYSEATESKHAWR
jgi:predicted RND superfamily exporter protein